MPLLRRATDDSQQDLFERDKAPWDKKIEPEAAGDRRHWRSDSTTTLTLLALPALYAFFSDGAPAAPGDAARDLDQAAE